ncbi:MAG: VanW family protein [Bacillota bacterium]
MEAALDQIQIELVGPEGRAKAISLREMGIIPASRVIFTAAHSYGRKKTWPLTYIERVKLSREGALIPFSYYLDEGLLAWGLGELENTFSLDPVNAFFKVSYARGEARAGLVPEINGYRINKDKFLTELQRVLDDPRTPFTVMVPGEIISPDITVSFLKEKGIEGLISSCSTRFDPANTDRVHNIKLAAGIIHNYFLAPGKTFSLNNLIGDTTPEKGYREAFVIIGEELVPGFGGGLCQVSTTLYNAALLAGLEILERHNHHMTIPYIAPGRDATMVYGVKDLKFRNNRDHYILITTAVGPDTLRFSLFGTPPEEKVIINTKILAVFDPPLKYEYTPELLRGEEEIIAGSPGYLVEVWQYVYRGERRVGEKRISLDSYTPHPTLVRRGVNH